VDTEVQASIGVGAAIRHALAVFLVLVGVLDIPAELSAGLPILFVIGVAAVCVTAAILLWVRGGEDPGFPPSEVRQLKELLDSAFASSRGPCE
jgi:hypothetical protein